MIIECTSCGAKYKYDENKLKTSKSKKVKCPKCKGAIDVASHSVSDLVASDPDRNETTFAAVQAGGSPEVAMENAVAERQESPKTTKVKKDSLRNDNTSSGVAAEDLMKLPETRKLSIAVISGNNSGEIYQINKPRMVIGRGDAEILIKDMEASRAHARIDVMGERVVLRDLNSTNGTFVNEQKITATSLENHSEFRIGTTVFMLIITDVE